MEMFEGIYSNIEMEADQPNGMVYTYQYMDQLDAESVKQELDGQMPALEDAMETDVFPEMTDFGLEPPHVVTYRYLNADDTLIWEHTFNSK